MRVGKTIIICDLCQKETHCHKNLAIPVYRTFDDTDGASFYEEPEFSNINGDFCYDCLKKISVVQNVGVQCKLLKFNPILAKESEGGGE